MDFGLTEEQRDIQKMTRDFAQDHIAPGAAERDRDKIFPRELFTQLGELGLMGACIPERYGGAGTDFLAYIPVSYTHLRAHETKANLVCRLLLEKKKKKKNNTLLLTI